MLMDFERAVIAAPRIVTVWIILLDQRSQYEIREWPEGGFRQRSGRFEKSLLIVIGDRL